MVAMERKFLSAVAYALRTSYKLGNEQTAWHLKSALLHARAHDGASANSAKHSAHPEPVRAISLHDTLKAVHFASVSPADELFAATLAPHVAPHVCFSAPSTCRLTPICLHDELRQNSDADTQTCENMITEPEVRQLVSGIMQKNSDGLQYTARQAEQHTRQQDETISSLQSLLDTAHRQIRALTSEATCVLARDDASDSSYQSCLEPASCGHESFLGDNDFRSLKPVSRSHACLSLLPSVSSHVSHRR